MTIEEQREFEELTSKQKAYYDEASKEHPDWSHEQLLTHVAILSNTTTGYIPEKEEESIWKKIKSIFS